MYCSLTVGDQEVHSGACPVRAVQSALTFGIGYIVRAGSGGFPTLGLLGAVYEAAPSKATAG